MEKVCIWTYKHSYESCRSYSAYQYKVQSSDADYFALLGTFFKMM